MDWSKFTGCDSIAVLNLIIFNSTQSTTYVTSCDSYYWNGTTYSTSGLFSYLTTNSIGCDSTAFLNLTINNSVAMNNDIAICHVIQSLLVQIFTPTPVAILITINC